MVGRPVGPGGYRRLGVGPAEPHRPHTDPAGTERTEDDEALLALAHLSDLHVCDAQSPARAEFLDRWSDPDSPIRDLIEDVGTYRAQEILTAQVADAMVRAVNEVDAAPYSGRALDFAIATGDNTDNSQANELDWYLALLEGGAVRPDSGDPDRYQGVADEVEFDERFWHPESASADLPRSRYGFPVVPGLLDAVRAPFRADGLRVPWLAVHGNHDQLLQGTVPGAGPLARAAVGSDKPIALSGDLTPDALVKLRGGLADCDASALAVLRHALCRTVAADPARRIVGTAEFVAAHFGPRSRPRGHGFDTGGVPYYRHDHHAAPDTVITMLVLDTVNPHGGWQGSLDPDQLDWLRGELTDADRDRRYVVLASHHPLHTLTNDITADARRRVLGDELAAVLSGHPSLVLWLNGHTHRTAITPHGTWWELTAPSLIDWPQQARIVELTRSHETLTIATTMLDHAGPAPWDGRLDTPVSLAGLSRELAANDWQWRDHDLERHPRAGTPHERNTVIRLADPWTA